MSTTDFGFHDQPFALTPNPRCVYPTAVYAAAYTTLVSGIRDRKGFIVLTGEPGTGKTTLLRRAMDAFQADPTVRVVYFDQTTVPFDEFLHYLCEALGLNVKERRVLPNIRAFNAFLRTQQQRGESSVLVIDEAHNLGEEFLESLRLFLSLETFNEKPLLQIVLAGHPELHLTLAHPKLRQLKQRVALQCQVDRLKEEEVGPFIRHQLHAVGGNSPDLFSPEAIRLIAAYSLGNPRVINVLCDNALRLTSRRAENRVSPALIQDVAYDLGLGEDAEKRGEECLQAATIGQSSPHPMRPNWEAPGAVPAPKRLAWLGGAGTLLTLLFLSLFLAQQDGSEAVPPSSVSSGRAVRQELQPPGPANRPAQPEQALDALLARAEAQMGARRLTTPSGDNALETYQHILRLFPAHEKARAGIVTIAEQYTQWARTAQEKDQWAKAQRYYEKAVTLNADDEMLRLALAQISKKRAEAQQRGTAKRRERVTAQVTAPQIGAGSSGPSHPARPAAKALPVVSAFSTGRLAPDAPAPALPAAAVITAAREGDIPTLQTWVENRPYSEVRDEQYKTALMWAADHGRGEAVQLLLATQSDVNAKTRSGKTALMYAAWNGHLPIVRTLLGRGATVNGKDTAGRTALMNAAIQGAPATVQALLDEGAEVDAPAQDGKTALMAAAWNNHPAVVHRLLESGAAVNLTNTEGWTALMYAAWTGDRSIVQLLLESGAAVNLTNTEGWTALMYAARNGHLPVVQALLDRGADAHITSNAGQTALAEAETYEHSEIVVLLASR